MNLPDWLTSMNWLPESARKPVLFAASAGVAIFGINWLISPSQAELSAEGRELFVHEWTVNDPLSNGGDGLGPVFNDKSCVACHFQGGVGGGGGNEQNVTAFEVLPNRNSPESHHGVVHANAIEGVDKETEEGIHNVFPIVPSTTTVIEGCTVRTPEFDPVLVEKVNTPALFGVGLIDEISAGSIKGRIRYRSVSSITDEFSLKFDGTPTGRAAHHSFGRVGRFGWKGQFTNLHDFVATACAVELGLTNRTRAQDKPGLHAPDDDAEYDMTNRQVDALVAFCRNLPRPEQVIPVDSVQRFKVVNGEQVFNRVGCADCHPREIDGVDGIFTDFALHILERETDGIGGYGIEDPEHEIPEGQTRPEEWQTPPLWGVADSAPYFHDGGSPTLETAILRHGAQGRHVTERYTKLQKSERDDLITFLKSLRAPQSASQADLPEAANEPRSLGGDPVDPRQPMIESSE